MSKQYSRGTVAACYLHADAGLRSTNAARRRPQALSAATPCWAAITAPKALKVVRNASVDPEILELA